MVYSKEFSVDSFKFWSYAADVVENVRRAGKMDDLEALVEETFCDRVPTETEINDFVWRDKGYIYSQLDLDENGRLPGEDGERGEAGRGLALPGGPAAQGGGK